MSRSDHDIDAAVRDALDARLSDVHASDDLLARIHKEAADAPVRVAVPKRVPWAAAAAAVFVAVSIGTALVLGGARDGERDTVTRLAGNADSTVLTSDADVRLLPEWVPDGYRLAWVDTPARSAETPTGPLSKRRHDYAYGYQSEEAELEVRVFVGETVDGTRDAVDGGVAGTVGGRPAVRWSDERVLVEVPGGVVHVRSVHFGGNRTPEGSLREPSSDTVDRFAASIAPAAGDVRDSVLSSPGVDVASVFGPKDSVPVIEGDGWELADGEFRPPLAVRNKAFWVDFGSTTGVAVLQGDFVGSGAWHVSISADEDTRVAWGVFGGDLAAVRVTLGVETYETAVVMAGGVSVFAVEVSAATADSGTVEMLDSAGNVVRAGPIRDGG